MNLSICVQGSGRRGLSLLEMLAAATILGIVALVVVSTARSGMSDAKRAACHVNVGDVELQAELWLQQTGSWPANSLSDIGDDLTFFPSGLPTCPVDGTTYTLDGSGRVVGHSH